VATYFQMNISTSHNDIKERLSVAYVTAVAARAGCQIAKVDIDKQSIDATVRPISGRKVSIDLQLKATSADCISGTEVVFDLPVKNYDDLRDLQSTAPHYLVVLVLDGNEDQWLASDESALLIRRCAYWVDLRGNPETENLSAIRVKIPTSQRFDVDALKAMIDDACKLVGTPEPLG
jgi:hypothetical protein